MSRSVAGWRLIARKEVGDSIRSRQLHSFAVLFVVLFAFTSYTVTGSAAVSPLEYLDTLSIVCLFIVPLAGLLLTHEAIVTKRAGGQLKLVFGLPHTRTGVVLGAYVGRFAIGTIVVVAGLLAATTVATLRGLSLPIPELLAFGGATVVLGLAYVAMGIGISAATRSTSVASIAAFGAFLLFFIGWLVVPDGLAYLANGFEMPASEPSWIPYVEALSPSVAYEYLLDAFVFEGSVDRFTGLAVGVLAGWILLVPALATRQFDRTDL